MKTIGFIGGMSWESTLEYYRIVNEEVKNRLGGFHSAKCLLYSVDFHEIEEMQHQGRWDDAAKILVDAAQKVERGGADFIAICTNTMHKLAEEVEAGIGIPLLHIADVTATKIQENGQQKVGLLGTKFTMEQDFYKGRLTEKYSIDVIIPPEEERDAIHAILYSELCIGDIKAESKEKFQEFIAHLASRGAEGIVLGCTEIPLIVKQEDYDIPLYDTTDLHAKAAVEMALQQ
ncbi:aspartate/glutamate racemase family protein [Acidobacteriota bacterium]